MIWNILKLNKYIIHVKCEDNWKSHIIFFIFVEGHIWWGAKIILDFTLKTAWGHMWCLRSAKHKVIDLTPFPILRSPQSVFLFADLFILQELEFSYLVTVQADQDLTHLVKQEIILKRSL